MTSATEQQPIQTSKKGEIGEFRPISLKFSQAFDRKLLGKGVDMIRQKNKARSANQKSRYASGASAKRGFYKWTSKMEHRLKKLKPSDWIAIAALVWKMFTAMLPYIS